jgi:hypothetical protein
MVQMTVFITDVRNGDRLTQIRRRYSATISRAALSSQSPRLPSLTPRLKFKVTRWSETNRFQSVDFEGAACPGRSASMPSAAASVGKRAAVWGQFQPRHLSPHQTKQSDDFVASAHAGAQHDGAAAFEGCQIVIGAVALVLDRMID